MNSEASPTYPSGADPVVAAHPVGEVVKTSVGRWGAATATFDKFSVYRFRMSRVWDSSASGRVCWVMLNPSTATEEVTDPTVERTLRFARSWGFGSSEVVNVFALRSTDPSALRRSADPVGPGNDDAIVAAAKSADVVVVAWGVHASLAGRSAEVSQLLSEAGVKMKCLKTTKAGHPGHPLYLPATSQLSDWSYAG